MSEKKDVFIFIEHILENIEDIEKFSKGISEKEFEEDSMVQKAVIKSIEIIGEASKNISGDIKRKYSSVPWKDIIGMRDKLIHHYFGIDLTTIWKVIKEDIPDFKEEILRIKKDIEEKRLKR
jgi:uncharacterized protein with HEPN domain